jgi:biopolymer transport protein TolR
MSNGQGGRGGLSEINVTPFVDVVLVLLVIFMVTAPMLQTGIQVDLPKATLDEVPTQNNPIILSMTREGDTYLGDTLFKKKERTSKLLPLLARKKDKIMYLRADQNLPYGAVAEFIKELHENGIRKVSLVTEAE